MGYRVFLRFVVGFEIGGFVVGSMDGLFFDRILGGFLGV